MAAHATDTDLSWGSIARGFGAGLLATVPMTIAMEALHRRLDPPERYPLPPRIITTHLLGGRGGRSETVEEVDADELTALTLLSHFGYGGACGALYALGERVMPGPRAASGVGFGLAVWAGSYLVWLPALGILEPATEHPRERTALMIAAHVVWGLGTGVALDVIERLAQPGDTAL